MYNQKRKRGGGTVVKIMVSACLLGRKCKYNGGDNASDRLIDVLRGHEIVPVCPEVAGGLPVPRRPCEIVDGTVMNDAGENVDAEFRHGAEICLSLAMEEKIDLAVLQPRSPSCGVGRIYDGTFSRRLTDGSGVFAALLAEHGFRTVTPDAFLEETEE